MRTLKLLCSATALTLLAGGAIRADDDEKEDKANEEKIHKEEKGKEEKGKKRGGRGA